METITKSDVKILARLEKLGFKKAAERAKKLEGKRKKLMIAYEFYRYVKREKINAFNQDLRKKTHNWDGVGGYHTLDLVKIEDYESAPPTDVLDCLEAAKDHNCFDSFEVAYIKKVKDPLLFGVIEGCSDKFFIAQWDDDVSINDLLKENEG